MRAPVFWSEDGLLPALLAPLGCLYAAAGRVRRATTAPTRVDAPVICVGNVVAGGAGKTPVALSLADRLAARGKAIHFLSRGYGGSEAGPLRVDPSGHSAAQVGDEPLLLAAQGPAWISRDRVAGAKAAVAGGAAVLVMDDGFQNPSLHKDLSLLVVDGGFGFGNGRVLPAGPLREPLSAALARAQAVVLIGDDRTGAARRCDGVPVLHARLVPDAEAAALAGRRVLAFAGIGRPEKFFDTLRELGADLVAVRSFADHHAFTAAEVEALLAEAQALGAIPVTTAKDQVRLPAGLRDAVTVVRVGLHWDDPAALDALLDTVVP